MQTEAVKRKRTWTLESEWNGTEHQLYQFYGSWVGIIYSLSICLFTGKIKITMFPRTLLWRLNEVMYAKYLAISFLLLINYYLFFKHFSANTPYYFSLKQISSHCILLPTCANVPALTPQWDCTLPEMVTLLSFSKVSTELIKPSVKVMVSAQQILGMSTELITWTQKIQRACKSRRVIVLFQAVKLGNHINFLMKS